MKKAFITGINGQDGSYLSEFLIQRGYEVHGIIRRTSSFTTAYIDHLNSNPNFYTYYGDLTDSSNLNNLMAKIKPDEIYNLGAQSHVAVSFEVPEYTADATGLGTLRLLDAMHSHCPKSKFYQASTSELFGGIPGTEPQSEDTPFYPKSPYGVAKLYSYWITSNYRESFDMFACNGILFNHESPRRGLTFVTRKITKAVAEIYANKLDCLYLGNLDSKRDWGHAKDYVKAMWMMLQSDNPKDYVVSTDECFTVRQFVEKAFSQINIKIIWEGSGLNEVGKCSNSSQIFVRINKKYFRPSEVELLLGDSKAIRRDLGWMPEYNLDALIAEMVNSDLEIFGK
jgi:GDPmannose 4,6-dehydratase